MISVAYEDADFYDSPLKLHSNAHSQFITLDFLIEKLGFNWYQHKKLDYFQNFFYAKMHRWLFPKKCTKKPYCESLCSFEAAV